MTYKNAFFLTFGSTTFFHYPIRFDAASSTERNAVVKAALKGKA